MSDGTSGVSLQYCFLREDALSTQLQLHPAWSQRQSNVRDDLRRAEGEPRPTVCHVLHSLEVGGCEVLAKDLAIEHADTFRPVFALLDDVGRLGHELADRGCVVEHIGRRGRFDLMCARRLAQFFHREGVTFVHAHQYGPLFYTALARLSNLNLPILFQEHGRDHPDFRRPKRVFANRLLLSRHDYFVAVGDSVREALVQFEGLERNRIEVIYNGIDLFAHHPHRPSRGIVRQELQFADDDFVVMQVARLNRLKDHTTAFRAIKEVLYRVPNIRLVLVGDGEERAALELKCRNLGLRTHVDFLGSRSDVPHLLQGADVFLLSSISEGIPLTLIEAMATGLPCVATDVGGTSEVVSNGETGLLAPAGDHHMLASHIAELAADQSLRARLGTAGRTRAETHFSSRRMHARYRALYRHLAGSDQDSNGQQPRRFTEE